VPKNPPTSLRDSLVVVWAGGSGGEKEDADRRANEAQKRGEEAWKEKEEARKEKEEHGKRRRRHRKRLQPSCNVFKNSRPT
jgi:hypothetical protein